MRAGTGDEITQAAVRVSTEVLALAPVIGRSPAQAFARLHVLAGGSGQPRSAEGAARLRSLSQTLLQTRSPALLVAAVVHVELLSAGAFDSHDGLVARAAERLVLVSRGVDPASLVVPEAGHLALREVYESNLRGYADGGRAGLHSWLLYAAQAQAKRRGVEPVASPLKHPGQVSGTGIEQESCAVSMPLVTWGLGYQACKFQLLIPGRSGVIQRPVGRVGRRVGTGPMWSVEL